MGWDLAPAGFTDDYTGTIADLVFQPGEFGPQAIVTVALDEPFTKDDGTLQNDRTIYLRIQRDFDVQPDGSLVHSGDASRQMKSDGSQWVKFAERVAELVPQAHEVLPGGVTDTKGWAEAGLRFHFMTEGQGQSYSFKDEKTGEAKSGKTKGQVMPVEYLGTTDAPQSGSVGASAPSSGFDLTVLPDDIIEAWAPLAEATPDNGVFQADVLKSGLLTQEKLGAGYQQVTAALGDGTLRQALSPVV